MRTRALRLTLVLVALPFLLSSCTFIKKTFKMEYEDIILSEKSITEYASSLKLFKSKLPAMSFPGEAQRTLENLEKSIETPDLWDDVSDTMIDDFLESSEEKAYPAAYYHAALGDSLAKVVGEELSDHFPDDLYKNISTAMAKRIYENVILFPGIIKIDKRYQRFVDEYSPIPELKFISEFENPDTPGLSLKVSELLVENMDNDDEPEILILYFVSRKERGNEAAYFLQPTLLDWYKGRYRRIEITRQDWEDITDCPRKWTSYSIDRTIKTEDRFLVCLKKETLTERSCVESKTGQENKKDKKKSGHIASASLSQRVQCFMPVENETAMNVALDIETSNTSFSHLTFPFYANTSATNKGAVPSRLMKSESSFSEENTVFKIESNDLAANLEREIMIQRKKEKKHLKLENGVFTDVPAEPK